MRPRGARQSHCPEEFEREAIGEIVVGEIHEFAALSGACIVHDDINLFESLDGEVHDALAGIRRPEIQREGFRCAPRGPDLGCGRVEQDLIAGSENDARSAGRKAQCDASPDSPARAGDNRNLSSK